MNYDKSKGSVELLREMKRNIDNNRHFCVGVLCQGCPFNKSDCDEEDRQERHELILSRLAAIERTRRTEFREGDRVWDYHLRDWGTVTKATKEAGFCIWVNYDNNYPYTYKKDGSRDNGGRRIFFQEIIIPPEALYTTDKPEKAEYTINELLEKAGLDPEKVRIKEVER